MLHISYEYGARSPDIRLVPPSLLYAFASVRDTQGRIRALQAASFVVLFSRCEDQLLVGEGLELVHRCTELLKALLTVYLFVIRPSEPNPCLIRAKAASEHSISTGWRRTRPEYPPRASPQPGLHHPLSLEIPLPCPSRFCFCRLRALHAHPSKKHAEAHGSGRARRRQVHLLAVQDILAQQRPQSRRSRRRYQHRRTRET